jgi:hypothetical protein
MTSYGPTDLEPLNEVPPVFVREPAGHEPRRLVADTNLNRVHRPARAIRDGSVTAPVVIPCASARDSTAPAGSIATRASTDIQR